MTRLLIGAIIICACLAAGNPALAGCPITNTLSNGNPADATQVMTNFTNLASCAAPASAPILTGDVIINSRDATYSSAFQIMTPNTGQQALTILGKAGKNYWQYGKEVDDSFIVYDDVAQRYAVQVFSNGNMSLMESGGGKVGIGTRYPAQTLDVVGAIKQSGCTTATTLSADTSGNIICTPSDARLKNIFGNYTGGLPEIARLVPKTFSYKPTSATATKDFVHAGFIAQEVRQVIPQAVAVQRSGYYTLDATAILAASVNAIKTLKSQNDRLQAANAKLESEDRALATRVTSLTKSEAYMKHLGVAQSAQLAALSRQVAELLIKANQRTAMK